MPPPRKNSSNGKTDREKKVASAEKDVSADLQAEGAPMMAELGSEPPGLAADRVKSSSAEFSVEPIQTAFEEQIEPSNPPVNLDEQQAAASSTENTESAETKLIPTRRKSKISGPGTSLQELQSEVDSEPDGLKDSSAEEVTDPPVRSLQTETVAEEAKETPAIVPDVSDPSAEVVKTADPEIPMRKKSKSFQVSTTSELVSPPGRGTDTLCEGPAEPEKLSTAPESGHAQDENKPLPPKRKSKGSELPLKSDAEKHQTKELPEVEGLASNNHTVVEETKLVPTRRKSKNGQVSINLETLSQVNSQMSSNTGMAHPVTLAEENKAKLSPMQRKAKGPKQTAEPAAKDTGKTSKEPDSQQSLVKTEGKLTPVRRRSKTSLAVIDLESKDARKEGKSRSISSATQGSALTAETTARKSQSPKISVKPSHKEEAKASGKKDEMTAVEETELIPTTRRSKENETTVVDKGKLSPAKRKPKSLKPSKGFPTRESSSPKMNPDKAISTVLDKGKLSPTKRKSKASKPSKELSTTELPKEKQEPLAPEMVKENPDVTESAVEEMVKLAPSERKSKGQKVCLQLSDKELVKEAEGSDLHALFPASDVDRTAAEIPMEENNGTSVDKVSSEGLKESSDLSEPETTNTTEESDTEKKLSSPEEVTPEVPVTGFIQSKEEPDTERPQSPPEMVPTEVSEIKPHWDHWKPNSDLSDQETSTSRDSDGQRSPSAVELEVESDGQEAAETAKEPTMEQEMDENTDEAPVPGQPEEGEEVPAPETSSALQRDTDETGISAAPACVESVTQAEVQESTNTVEEENTTPFMENNLPHLSSEPAGALKLSEYIDSLWKDADETERRYLVLDVPEVSFSQTSDRAPDHRETAVEPSPEPDSEEPSDKDTSAEAETEEDTAGVQHAVSEEVLAQTALLSEGRPNQEMMEPLETCPSEDVDVEEGNTPETGEEEAGICMQREEAPEGEIIITADITLQEPSAEVKVQERGADAADDPLQGGSAESITPFEFIEISVYETSQIETSTEPLEVARISPAPLQEHQVREEPEILEENYVKMETIEKGSEVHIFHQDAQASVEEEETMSVKITKEPTADVNLSIQFGKDLTSADVLPEMDTVELTVFGVTTEEQDLQEQGPVQGSEQVSEGERTAADLQHEEAAGEEEHGPDQKQSFSSQSLTYLELKDEPDAHTEWKDEGESDVEVAPSDVYDAADSLAEQEPREESSSSLEMVGAGKDMPASEVPSDATVVMGEASDSPAPSAPAEQQVVDTQEKPQDQEENKKINIPGQEKDTTEGEIVGLEPPIVQMGSTLEEIRSAESPQVRCHCIFARSHFQSQ